MKKLFITIGAVLVMLFGITGCAETVENPESLPLGSIYRTESPMFSSDKFVLVTETGLEEFEDCTMEHIFAPYTCKTTDNKYTLSYHKSKNSSFMYPTVEKHGEELDYDCVEPFLGSPYCMPN